MNLSALVRFHCRAGARVALRANAIIGGAVVFFYGIQDDALRRLRASILELVAHHAGWYARMDLAAICLALTGVAMPRVVHGATGWLRSLPSSSSTHRRAVVVALCTTQAFAIIIAVLAVIGAAGVYHAALDPGKILGIPLMVLASAALVLPVERKAGPALAAFALICAVPGRVTPDIVSAALLIAGDRFSGGITRLRRRSPYRARRQLASSSPVLQWIFLTLRSLSLASVIAAFFLPVIFVAFAYFIVLHNPDLDAEVAHRTVRVCGAGALCTLAAALANSIVRTRPAWPWVRSLPWSSRQRVAGDVAIHLTALVVIPLALVPLDWRNAAIVALLVPAIATCATAAIRVAGRRQTSAAGEIVVLGLVYGTLIALWPPSVLVVVVGSPLSFVLAERREQRLVVTRWDELHHDAVGDPVWMSAT